MVMDRKQNLLQEQPVDRAAADVFLCFCFENCMTYEAKMQTVQIVM
ncbi:unnamed protein product [Amoebophrya sp. A120]|nr:unnamed protein product [Amoebophrya sp. A120]|eukprot:GSA120T00021613001.1